MDAALAGGHEVCAGVHHVSNSHLPQRDGLEIRRCDATSEADLKKLLAGCDAVCSFIGHVHGSPPDVQTEATRKLVATMEELGIGRLVSLTGTGVRLPGDKLTLLDRFLNLGIKLVDPPRVRDGIEHFAVLKASGLDWTVIRVLKLQNTKPKSFVLTEHGPTKLYVGREEVARAALQVLEQKSFIRQAPIISRPRI